MRFGVLGSLVVSDDAGRSVLPRSRMQRLLLALLLSRANETVSSDLLIEELWHGDPPPTARTNLQVYVHRLRQVLGGDRIVHRGTGYTVDLASSELDVHAFEEAAAAGRQALEAGDHRTAAGSFAVALDCWRGPAYDGFDDHQFVRDEAARLNDLRLVTIENRFDTELTLGRHADLVAELATLVRQNPLRERLCEQLMLALYRSGRAAEALETYRQVRQRLVEEIGVEPGAALKRLHQAILAEDPALEATKPQHAYVVPAELPPGARSFTGRAQYVDRVTGRLRSGATDVPVVVAIDGPGGIGKSTLAVQIAHLVADSFPGGQLYVNLRAATPGITPLDPAEALGRLLRSLGLDDAAIPADAEEAAARFRSLTADRRVLVVLDDAADPAQVRPLIPGAGCAVLLTSRQVLATLDAAEHVHLAALTADEAVSLLGGLAGSDRVVAEPEQAAEIVRFCGCLPLAVRIAGARLAARQDWTLATLARRLGDARARLDELEHADLAVRASCAVSYHGLPLAAARLFDLLGTLELPDTTTPVAAALADQPQHHVQRWLDQLVDAQLLTSDNDRYALHDLVRLYARERALDSLDAADRSAAVERVLHHYLATARTAMRLTWINSERRLALGLPESAITMPGVNLPDAARASAWAAVESANLVAAARHAANMPGNGPAILVGLAIALKYPLVGNGRWTAIITIDHLALLAAESMDRSAWRAMIHYDLGSSYTRLERYAEAEKHVFAALTAFREADDQHATAGALNQCGSLAERMGRVDEAIAYYQEALAAHEGERDFPGAAVVLNNLGTLYNHLGNFDKAVPYWERAVAIFEEAGDRRSRAVALANLGGGRGDAGEPVLAVPYLLAALETFQEIGERHLEATTLWELGAAMHALKRSDEARERWRQSLQVLCELDVMTPAEADKILTEPVPGKPAALRDM